MNEKCKAKVTRGSWGRQYGCSKNATRDGYCGTHHPEAVARRKEKSKQAWGDKMARYQAKQDREGFNARAGNRCRELGIQPEDICPPK